MTARIKCAGENEQRPVGGCLCRHPSTGLPLTPEPGGLSRPHKPEAAASGVEPLERLSLTASCSPRRG